MLSYYHPPENALKIGGEVNQVTQLQEHREEHRQEHRQEQRDKGSRVPKVAAASVRIEISAIGTSIVVKVSNRTS